MQYRRTESNFPTFESRLEDFTKWQDHLPHYFSKGVELNPMNNVAAVVNHNYEDLGVWEKEWNYGANIITTNGDIYYALKGIGGSPAANENFFQSRAELNNPGSADTLAKGDNYAQMLTPITASRHTITATYPKVSDADADNPGMTAAIITYKYDWLTTDFNDGGTTIKGGSLHDNASPVSGTKLLTHFSFSSAFNKTSSDTLKVFVNHTVLGA